MNQRFSAPRGPRDREPPRSTPEGGRSRAPWRALRLAGGVLAVLAAAGAIVGVLAVKTLVDQTPPLPDPSALAIANAAPGITFETADGRVIATRGPRRGHMVSLSELPAYAPRAFLAAEDRRFYQHGPIDLQGVTRALGANLRSGHIVQGGSTLTQQLAKTLFLTPDQTLRRKLQEAVIAWRMEQVMSKDEILALYLNRVFFGDNAYGIDAAARTYFGHPASQLTLQEAALLAALPKAPTRLAPTNDMAAALARSRLILAIMRDEGWISPAEEQAALADPPRLAPEAPGEGDFGYVLDMAAAQAIQLVGDQAPPDLVVRLTVDPALQLAAQSVVRQAVANQGRGGHFSQGAVVVLAPDGAIRALVGGADHRASSFNRAAQARRQPGSAFKPFIYAAALENGARPSDTRQDAPVSIGGWTPTNYGGGYRGTVTLAQALALSINTVAVRLANESGAVRIGEIAHRFGLKDIPDQPNLSIALGAYEVSLLELTSAYQVFQNGGARGEPYLIGQIADQRGDVLYTHVSSTGAPVYDPVHAGEMVRMMEGVVAGGTGARAAFGRPAAGKTGTSQNWRDAWFIGFTPDWICGVWVGNDDNSPMNRVTGGSAPADIWRRVMLAADGGSPARDFDLPPEPAAIDDGQIAESGELAVDGVAADGDMAGDSEADETIPSAEHPLDLPPPDDPGAPSADSQAGRP